MRKPMKTKVFSLVNDNLPAGHTLCLFYLTVLYGVSAAQPKLNYVVLLPAELHYPSTEKACLLLDRAVGISKYSITVTLEHSGGSVVLFPKEGCPKLPLSCCSFIVPPPSKGNSEVATVKIQATGDITFVETNTVLIQKINDGIVIQTDKAAYKPGDTVLFRIVTLNDNFLCSKTAYNVVELKDPKNNRIAQWLKTPTKMCIAELSFNISSDPILGTYTITVENSQMQTFIVREEVLPRFEVTIEEPTKIYVTEPTFQLKVCGTYTYGKGVVGSVSVQLCNANTWNLWSWRGTSCTYLNGEADKSGCFSTMTQPTGLNADLDIEISANFTEKDTGVSFSAKKVIPVESSPETIIYEEFATYYRRGYPFYIRLFVQDRNGLPVPDKKVRIFYGESNIYKYNYTDKSGKVTFILDTSDWINQVTVQPYLGDSDIVLPSRTVSPLYSEAKSSLRLEPFYRVIPCGNTETVHVQYVINPLDLEEGTKSVNFYYTVVGKAGILSYETQAIQLRDSSSLNGTLRVPITFTQQFGAAPKMIGFLILKNGNVVADRLFIDVEVCFPNPATLWFKSSESSPKAKIDLTLSSSAGSVCALRAVDKSVQIQFKDKELTRELVISLFPNSVRGGYPDELIEERLDGCFGFSEDVDVFSLFKDVGLKILTNMPIQKPLGKKLCPTFVIDDVIFEDRRPELVLASVSSSQDVVRKFFPETWLWSLVEIGKIGSTSITVTVPDTITKFNARTFCIGNSGFGLSSEVSLIVFKPFFVELAMPYSIIQGETLTLKALVFNYLTQCLKVQVTLLSSPNFTIQDCKGCVYIKCICADESANFIWNITANKIGFVPLTVRAEAIKSTDTCAGKVVYVPPTGNLDILEKPLLVKPQGIKKELAQSMFICLKDPDNNIEKPFSLEVPKNLVKDSESAYVSVIGDVLGTALQNLDRLITMPSGCGEQNMLTMAPIIYVLGYLSATGQLEASLKDKALSYLQSGYQRELSYKHTDGSYSAFGESDGEGGTWLTAFVMKCFYQAKKYIFIDDQILDQALKWLASGQNNNGCFTNRGRLIHTTMKGGVNDDVSLCAYITAALLERGGSVQPIKLDLALSNLRAKVDGISNPYTLALLAYTFTLANDIVTRQKLLSRLNLLSQSSGTDLYWTYTSSSSEGSLSADVELTAYVLLALISGSAPTLEELTTASRIVSWLSKKQNPYGGFSSTQDTVVAIQALAEYTKVTFNPRSNLMVTVSANKVILYSFTVNNTNRLLLQKGSLTAIPGQYQLSIRGNGCVLIQIVLKYNVLLLLEKSPFTISAKIDNCGIKYGQYGQLIVIVRYDGPRKTTNMVLIEVELLSGFSVTEDTKSLLLRSPFVKRVDFSKGLITIYLDELNHETQRYYIDLVQDLLVYDLKPVNVNIFDYYQKEESATTTYSPCPSPIRKS